MKKKIYCTFCGNPSLIDDNSELREQLDQARSTDHEWFNDAISTINELRQHIAQDLAELESTQLNEQMSRDVLEDLEAMKLYPKWAKEAEEQEETEREAYKGTIDISS